MSAPSSIRIPAALRPDDFRSQILRKAITLPAYTYTKPAFHEFETQAAFSRNCRVLFNYFYGDTESGLAKQAIAEDMQFSDKAQREDIVICERVQQGLKSGACEAARLSPKREAGVHHFQELVRMAYRQALNKN